MYIIVVLVYSVIWSFVCAKVVENKGYEAGNWYIWGFLFGIFAFLVAVTKQPYIAPVVEDTTLSKITRENEEIEIRKKVARGELWECPSCKKANSNYITTCSCGTPKPTAKPVERTNIERWQCVNCGKENTINFAICKCGMKKSENDKRVASGEKYMMSQETEQNETDKLDILKKYKELLDMGAISQEEFDIKKKELI